jgi:hypothetical protein
VNDLGSAQYPVVDTILSVIQGTDCGVPLI